MMSRLMMLFCFPSLSSAARAPALPALLICDATARHACRARPTWWTGAGSAAGSGERAPREMQSRAISADLGASRRIRGCCVLDEAHAIKRADSARAACSAGCTPQRVHRRTEAWPVCAVGAIPTAFAPPLGARHLLAPPSLPPPSRHTHSHGAARRALVHTSTQTTQTSTLAQSRGSSLALTTPVHTRSGHVRPPQAQRVLLTGTPVQNNTRELLTLLSFMLCR